MQTQTSAPQILPTKQILPSSTMEIATSTPKPTVISPTNTLEPEPTICSPLQEHSIHDLQGIVSDPYSPPLMGKDDRHQGVDFAYYNHNGRKSIDGEGVQAILPGKVAAVVQDRLPYGNMVIIETSRKNIPDHTSQELNLNYGESVYHLYAHMQNYPQVTIGQQVDCGQLLGTVGKTGYNIPVAHLHLETRIGPANTIFGILAFYDTKADPQEMEMYKLWRMSGEFRHFDPLALFLAFSHQSETD